MPTYNFTTAGDIYQDGQLIRTIEGPAVLSPKVNSGTFSLRYLDGSDLFYYPTNIYKIDGELFEGTLEEFCTTAGALYETAGGGGGQAYPDVDANTTSTIDDTKALIFQTGGFYEMLKLESDTGGGTTHKETLGDHNATVTLTEYEDGTADYAVQIAGPAGITSGFYAGAFDGFSDAQVYAVNHIFRATHTGFTFAGEGAVSFNNTGGLKLPEVTKAQRNALDAYAGFAVFQTDNTPGLRVFDGTNWKKFSETNDD